MTEPAPARPHKMGALWGVLTLFLLIGTVAAAFVVYGFTDLLSSGRVFPDVAVMVVAFSVTVFMILLITGILYRVDRIRGVIRKEVRLFE